MTCVDRGVSSQALPRAGIGKPAIDGLIVAHQGLQRFTGKTHGTQIVHPIPKQATTCACSGFLTPFDANDFKHCLERVLASSKAGGQPIYCTLRTRKRCELRNAGQLVCVHNVLNEVGTGAMHRAFGGLILSWRVMRVCQTSCTGGKSLPLKVVLVVVLLIYETAAASTVHAGTARGCMLGQSTAPSSSLAWLPVLRDS